MLTELEGLALAAATAAAVVEGGGATEVTYVHGHKVHRPVQTSAGITPAAGSGATVGAGVDGTTGKRQRQRTRPRANSDGIPAAAATATAGAATNPDSTDASPADTARPEGVTAAAGASNVPAVTTAAGASTPKALRRLMHR